jgi:hypothetical protein
MKHSTSEFIKKWGDCGLPIVPVSIVNKKMTVDPSKWVDNYSKQNVIRHFTDHPLDAPKLLVPEGVVGLGAVAPQFDETFRHYVEGFGIPELRSADGFCFYRCSNPSALKEIVPEGVAVIMPGDLIQSDLTCRDGFRSIADLDEIELPAAPPAEVKTPLTGMSLLGHAEAFAARALACKPLLGNVAMMGQSTIWYAAPNAGKTLLVLHLLFLAITRKDVLGSNCYYINADDNAHGLAEKMRLCEEYGVHTVVPGEKGFDISRLVELLETMAHDDQCLGVVIVLDTVKKAVDLMDKRLSHKFGGAVRQFTQRGGTFIGLAHTRKNPSSTGKAVYGGTTDLVEDCDAVFMLTTLSEDDTKQLKTVQFQAIKQRGGGADEAYAYTTAPDSYQDLLASVVLVDPGDVREVQDAAARENEEPIINAIVSCIEQGICSKMQLVAAVAERTRVSRRAALAVLERYESAEGYWLYAVKARGAKVYSLSPSG